MTSNTVNRICCSCITHTYVHTYIQHPQVYVHIYIIYKVGDIVFDPMCLFFSQSGFAPENNNHRKATMWLESRIHILSMLQLGVISPSIFSLSPNRFEHAQYIYMHKFFLRKNSSMPIYLFFSHNIIQRDHRKC